jgi:hypothetical protein
VSKTPKIASKTPKKHIFRPQIVHLPCFSEGCEVQNDAKIGSFEIGNRNFGKSEVKINRKKRGEMQNNFNDICVFVRKKKKKVAVAVAGWQWGGGSGRVPVAGGSVAV